MLWFWLTLMAAAGWAVCNIIDKFLMEKRVKDVEPLLVFSGVSLLIFSFAIFAVVGIRPSFDFLHLLSIGRGCLWVGILYFYLGAIKRDDISRVTPLFGLQVILITVLGVALFGEIFSAWKYVGVALIMLGAFLLAFRRDAGITRKSDALVFVLLAVFFIAMSYPIDKWVLGMMNRWEYVAHTFLGSAVGFVFLLKQKFRKSFVELARGSWHLVLTTNLLGAAFDVAVIYAISLGPISLISPLLQTQGMFLLAYTVLVARFFPGILKEEVGLKVTGIKFLAILLILAGVYLIGR